MSDARDTLPPLARLYSHPASAAILNEAMALLGDGISATAIESAALDAAMPCGALAIIDAVSLEVIDHHLHESMHSHDHKHAHGHGHADQGGHDHDHQHDHGHADEHHSKHDHGHDHGHAGKHSQSRDRDHAHVSELEIHREHVHGGDDIGKSGAMCLQTVVPIDVYVSVHDVF